MIYAWYKIFNLTEFNALGLVCKTYTLDLDQIGQADVLVTKGNFTSIAYDDVFLILNFNNENPYEKDDHAIYLDEATQDVYFGMPTT